MRLFLDANVLFTAAHNPAGKARFLFDAAEQGAWRLIASDYAIEEAGRNLIRKSPRSCSTSTGYARTSNVSCMILRWPAHLG